LLRKLEVTSLLDVPCGDFTWMKHVELDGIDYIGGDIVGEMISKLQQQYGRPGRSFRRIDLVCDDLPPVDAVMVRDLFLHLPLQLVHRAIANLQRSGAKWLLTSNYPAVPANADIPMGHHRFQNLMLPPFSWPPPLHVINEMSTTAQGPTDKQLAAWLIVDLPDQRRRPLDVRL